MIAIVIVIAPGPAAVHLNRRPKACGLEDLPLAAVPMLVLVGQRRKAVVTIVTVVPSRQQLCGKAER